MANADIGPKIGIDGEAEFRRQIQDISNGIKTLGTEMKVVTTQYQQNENSVEALTAQNDVLDRTISSLNEKLAVQKQMLAECANAYGEADERTQKWQQVVNNTTAEINKAQNAYDANTQQLEKLGNAGQGVFGLLKNGAGTLAESLSGKLGSALGMSTSQVKQLTSTFTGASSGMQGVNASAGVAAAGVLALGAAAVKAGEQLVEFAKKGGAAADEINTTATKFNLSTQAVQQFQYMAELTDTSVETITGSISKLTRNMDGARDGTGTAAEAFSRLGISITNGDGSLRSANDVFAEAIDALGRVGNETERDALAMEIFGKSAMELNPLIAAGSETIRAYAEEAEACGYVMSEKMLTSLQAVDDAGVKLDNSMDALHNTLGAAVAPAVSTVEEALAGMIGGIANGIQELAGMKDQADTTADAMNTLASAIQGVRDLDTSNPMDMLSKDRAAYTEYLRQANATQEALGYNIGIASYDSWKAAYDKGHSTTIQLDGYTVGKAYTPYINQANYQTGSIM